MARAALLRGHNVTMLCGSHGSGKTGLSGPFERGVRKGEVDGIHVVEYDLAYSNSDGFLRRFVTFFQFALSTLKFALVEKYDLLFATSTPLTVAVPGIAARWLRRKKFVFEVRDLWPELPHAMGAIRNPIILGAMRFLEWTAYKSATKLIGLSPGIVDGVRAGAGDRPVALIPNGCDLDIFGTDIAIWQPDGVEEHDLMAIFSGTHGMANGLDALLDTAAELKSRGQKRVKIVLIGTGGLKKSLQDRALVDRLDNVIFMDPVNKTRLSALMRRADIGIQCLANVPAFYFGTSPNKFFDYIAAGLPVLNNYPGWLANLISNYHCGIAVAPEDPSAMADALEKLVDDRKILDDMGRSARELAEREFDRKNLADVWVNFITT
jgi:glycosyltransferase involved in cell wall biosynthesis